MRLNRTQRLLVAIAFTVVTLAFLWRPYRDALQRINQSLLTPVSSDGAPAADDKPSDDRMWRQCQDSVWPGYLWCSEPWHSGSPPWEDR